jgi:hypothetical protein
MVEIPRSSFIPKESMGMTPDRVRRGRTFHVFGFVGSAILIGSLIGAGAVFLLKGAAQRELERAQTALSAQKNVFNSEHVAEVRDFDRKLKAAQVLLNNHISPLRVFNALENKTKKKVQFTSFTMKRTSPSEVLVTLTGKTEVFKTLALQELGFADDSLLKNVVFSEVVTTDSTRANGGTIASATTTTDRGRGINFTLAGSVDTSLIVYTGTPASALERPAFIDDNGRVSQAPAPRETGTPSGGEAVLGASITQEPL